MLVKTEDWSFLPIRFDRKKLYVRMIAALLPHKHEVRQGDDVSSMTDAELERAESSG